MITILTYKLLHKIDFSQEVEKALTIAQYVVKKLDIQFEGLAYWTKSNVTNHPQEIRPE